MSGRADPGSFDEKIKASGILEIGFSHIFMLLRHEQLVDTVA